MEGKPPLRREKRQRGSGFESTHAIGQQPQGAVQANVRINALHGAGLLAASVGAAPGQAALGQVLLRAVEHAPQVGAADRKSTRLNSSHLVISYAVFCLKKKTTVPVLNDILLLSIAAQYILNIRSGSD